MAKLKNGLSFTVLRKYEVLDIKIETRTKIPMYYKRWGENAWQRAINGCWVDILDPKEYLRLETYFQEFLSESDV